MGLVLLCVVVRVGENGVPPIGARQPGGIARVTPNPENNKMQILRLLRKRTNERVCQLETPAV